MMKNTEWGTVAYLSRSAYGKNAEVTINANSSSLTGGGNYISNVAQSTTGNIYGIYDMSGSAWEYVAGVLGSGSDKYYNHYSGYTSTSFGDAVYETSSTTGGSYSWYGDYANMPNSLGQWFVRGGHRGLGSSAGLFSFDRTAGAANDTRSWRVVVMVGDGL